MVTITSEHIKALKSDNRIVQKQVFEILYKPMFRICYRYIGSYDEAEDCLMKGFLKAFKQTNGFEWKNDASYYYWVRKIMVNECLMTLRKSRNFNMTLEENIPETGVDAEVWQKLDAEYLHDKIMLLPTGYRTVFSLYVIEGYSHQEISKLLNIQESTSKTQLLKARMKLQEMIEPQNRNYGNN